MRETQRFVGLSLAGSRNQKTAIAVLESYPREKKIFLLDLHDRIGGESTQEADRDLLNRLDDLRAPGQAGELIIGVNAPLQLPECSTKGCHHDPRKAAPSRGAKACASYTWWQGFQRANRHQRDFPDFTPYTQRPVDVWIRAKPLAELPENLHFEVDETLGGTRAPITARMAYLKPLLKGACWYEVWPKLSVAQFSLGLELSKRTLQSYRRLEDGAPAREQIIEAIARAHGIFVYERDARMLAAHLQTFDAFICATTAWLAAGRHTVPAPRAFPVQTGWVAYPSPTRPKPESTR